MTHGERRAQTHNWLHIEAALKEGARLEIAFTASSYACTLIVQNTVKLARGEGKCLEWALDSLEWQLEDDIVP